MKIPLLKQESKKQILPSTCVYLLFGAAFFALASYVFLLAPDKAPEQIEKYVGVWDDAMVKQCVSVRETCVGKWITENIEQWQDAIEPELNAAGPSPFSPRKKDRMPNSPKSVVSTPKTGSRRKLLMDELTQEIDDDVPQWQFSGEGLALNPQFGLGWGSFSSPGLNLNLELASERTVTAEEDIYPGETRVPYICRDYSSFDPAMDCSAAEDRWVEGSEKELGEGAFGVVYVSKYDMSSAKNQFLSPSFDPSQPKVVQKRAKGNVKIGHIMVEALLMFAAQDRMQDVTVKAVDVYENWLITHPVADGDLGGIADDIKGNPGAATYIASQMYDKIDGMHKNGLVHRDIKPGNVLFMIKPFRIILGDVGSALPLPEHNAVKMDLPTGGMTLQYMSPELGDSTVKNAGCDYRSNDLWAASVSVFSLYFGKSFMNIKLSGISSESEMSTAMQTYFTSGKVDDQLKSVLTEEELKDPLIPFFKIVLAPKAGGRSDGAALKTLATEYFTKLKGDFHLNTFAVAPPKPKPSPKTAPAAPQKPEKKEKAPEAKTAPVKPTDRKKRAEHSNE